MNQDPEIRRPILASHARYRWDELRQQHQVVFPEGVLVLNESAAAIVNRCDGRPIEDLIATLEHEFAGAEHPLDPAADVRAFLDRLARKGLLRNAAGS